MYSISDSLGKAHQQFCFFFQKRYALFVEIGAISTEVYSKLWTSFRIYNLIMTEISNFSLKCNDQWTTVQTNLPRLKVVIHITYATKMKEFYTSMKIILIDNNYISVCDYLTTFIYDIRTNKIMQSLTRTCTMSLTLSSIIFFLNTQR